MQTRLDKYEEQLTRQYSQLESLMGSLQSQSASLTAALAQS
jgi:flagellar capping protein FliD